MERRKIGLRDGTEIPHRRQGLDERADVVVFSTIITVAVPIRNIVSHLATADRVNSGFMTAPGNYATWIVGCGGCQRTSRMTCCPDIAESPSGFVTNPRECYRPVRSWKWTTPTIFLGVAVGRTTEQEGINGWPEGYRAWEAQGEENPKTQILD